MPITEVYNAAVKVLSPKTGKLKRKRKVFSRKLKEIPWPKEAEELLIKYYTKGFDMHTIAEYFGVNHTQVTRKVKRMNLKKLRRDHSEEASRY